MGVGLVMTLVKLLASTSTFLAEKMASSSLHPVPPEPSTHITLCYTRYTRTTPVKSVSALMNIQK